jgi:apolipoprotein N-acyltransferase
LVIEKEKISQRNPLTISVIQPNIDTFEKWTVDPTVPLDILKNQMKEVRAIHPDLVLWPETAIPFYILHPQNRYQLNQIRQLVDYLDVYLLTGIPDIEYYPQANKYPRSSKKSINGERYDTYNSSMLISPRDNNIQKYAKIVLVPFAERVPFSEELSFLDIMEWNFGLGGWGHGRDTTVFNIKNHFGEEVKFSNLICYESVCPNFVRLFVNKGAEFLTVITNDSWWGNTSGAYQHKQFAILRAIENRRWVIQCANGGISCFIDPYGNIIRETKMYVKTEITDKIEPKTEITFYTRHGDWLAEICIILGLFMMMAGIGNKYYKTIRRSN